MKKITIDPVTRLEGHGKIEIFLKDNGEVENTYLQIPELRGFEKFVEGRPAEDMPQITQRICGVCPEAHHIASARALDDLFQVEPPLTARLIRELFYASFMVADHTTHFFVLAGPDFIVGPDSPVAERNILGMISKLGLELAGTVIKTRQKNHHVIKMLGGRPVHPVFGLPGGVSKGVTEEERAEISQIARENIEFARTALKLFHDLALKNPEFRELLFDEAYIQRTYYLGLVDSQNRVSFYDGGFKIIDPDGKEVAAFEPRQYTDYIAEQVEPWSYMRFPFLKKIGWQGFREGKEGSIYRVGPLARLNVSEGMATPLAQEEYQNFYATLGAKPVHQTLATHWARLIELLYAAEYMYELSGRPEITGENYRSIPQAVPHEGIGAIEAPRGTLIHHYLTDSKGLIRRADLLVATANNAAALNLSIKKAAQSLIRPGRPVTEGLLNRIEMAWRAYDPCFGCSTHALESRPPLEVLIRNSDGTLRRRLFSQ